MTNLPIRSAHRAVRPSPLATFAVRHPALIILLTLPLFLTFYGHGQAVDMMEMFNLVPVKEAFRDSHWLMPTLNGFPRLEKPPLPVWIPAALASLVHSDSLYVTRLPSALMCLLTCYAVFWIGKLTTRDRFLPLAAALVLATMLYFLRQGRLAGYDIYVTAFTTVGLAGLFGITEGRPRHRLWFALLAGFSFGLALLSKGPVPPATVCIPFGIYMLIHHRHRNTFLWLIPALLVCLATALPWLIAIAHEYPAAWTTWKAEFFQYSSAEEPQYRASPFYYFVFLLWVGPWTPAFVAGLLLPFFHRTTIPAPLPEERRARWAFMFIVLAGLILLTIPHEKKPRYALPLMPVAALAVAALWQQYTRIALTQRVDRPARVLLHIHTLVIAGAAALILVAIPIAHGLHLSLIPASWSQIHWDAHIGGALPLFNGQWWRWLIALWSQKSYNALLPLLSVVPTPLWIGLAVFLAAAALLFHRAARDRLFTQAFFVAVVAHYALLITIFTAYRGADFYQSNPYAPAILAGLEPAGRHPVYTLDAYHPWLHVLYYADHPLPAKTPAELTKLIENSHDPIYVLTSSDLDSVVKKIAGASHRTAVTVSQFSDEHNPLNLYKVIELP